MVVVMIMMVSARLTRAFLLSVIALHLYPFSAWNTLSRLQLDRFLPAISEQAGVGLCLEFVGFIQWRSHTINRGWSNIPLLTEIPFVSGITLLFTEPPDARKPNVRWRLYVFKAGEVLNEPLYVHRQSCYLFGRERRVADIPTDHPSCSKQHAVIQFRLVEKEKPDGMMSKQVRPYLMDLGSTNGTFINDNRIEPQRYYELIEKDTIKFGNSSREYVILHENSTD